MKKIFYSAFLLLSSALITSAQKSVDLSIELKERSGDFVAGKDSFMLLYVIKNNGPDVLLPGDTLRFHDPEIEDDRIWYGVFTDTFQVGSEEIISEKTHLNKIKTLYLENGTAVSPPFAPGTYTFGVVVSPQSSVYQDPDLSNNFSTVKITIEATGIDNINNAQQQFKLFPTYVSNGILNLEFNLPELATASFKIVDLKGATVLSSDLGTVSAGKQINQINVKSLAMGTYLFQLNTNGKLYSQQIVITQ